MKTMTRVLISCVLLIFNGCTENKKSNVIRSDFKSKYFSFERASELKFNVIKKGDIQSYRNLIVYYEYNPDMYYEMLPISIIMSNNYGLPEANSEVYKSFIKINNKGKFNNYFYDKLEFETKKIAISYLIKGSKLKDIESISLLNNLYRNGIGMSLDNNKADSLKNIALEMNKHFKERSFSKE